MIPRIEIERRGCFGEEYRIHHTYFFVKVTFAAVEGRHCSFVATR